MLVNIFAFAQEKTLTGLVTSERDNSPLLGVFIIILNAPKGVQTDFDGKCAIKLTYTHWKKDKKLICLQEN